MKARIIRKFGVGLAAGMFALFAGSVQAVNDTSPSPDPSSPSAAPMPSNVADVLKMDQAKVADDTIIAYIQNSGTTFHLDAGQIIYLRDHGLSDAVLTTMLQSGPAAPAENPQMANGQTQTPDTTTTPPAPPDVNPGDMSTSGQPTVIYVNSAPVYYYPAWGFSWWWPVGVTWGWAWWGGCWHWGCHNGGGFHSCGFWNHGFHGFSGFHAGFHTGFNQGFAHGFNHGFNSAHGFNNGMNGFHTASAFNTANGFHGSVAGFNTANGFHGNIAGFNTAGGFHGSISGGSSVVHFGGMSGGSFHGFNGGGMGGGGGMHFSGGGMGGGGGHMGGGGGGMHGGGGMGGGHR
jgi:hypothetical protein